MLILMHGLPGSGKSYMAKKFLTSFQDVGESVTYHSTDTYFMKYVRRGCIETSEYQFDPLKIGEYHKKNQMAALKSFQNGTSVVIVDNTNLTCKECRPYAKMALDHNHTIQIVEPPTDWRYNVDELVKRNSHNVPRESIERMLDRRENIEDIAEELAERLGYQCASLELPEFSISVQILTKGENV